MQSVIMDVVITVALEIAVTIFGTAKEDMLALPLTRTAPINGRWQSPCAGKRHILNMDLFTFFDNIVIVSDPLRVATNLKIKCEEGQTIAEQIKDNYADKRIPDDVVDRNLVDAHLPGFPTIAMTPHIIRNTKVNPLQAHLANFRKLSIAAVFLEQVVTDEDLHGYKEYSSRFKRLQAKIYSILCELYLAIKAAGGHINEYVTPTVMSLELRHITETSRRYERDYIVIKDISELIETLNVQYGAWKKFIIAESRN